MAFKLGVAGSEYTLPYPTFASGSGSTVAEDHDLGHLSEKVLDGSEVHDFAEVELRSWRFTWSRLTGSEKATFDTIAALRCELNLICDFLGITSEACVVEDYAPEFRTETYSRTPLWQATLVLREV